jgi:hypothetical protein
MHLLVAYNAFHLCSARFARSHEVVLTVFLRSSLPSAFSPEVMQNLSWILRLMHLLLSPLHFQFAFAAMYAFSI